MKRARLGQAVKIADYFSAMRTCINRDRGDGVLYGAGGCVLPSGILEQPAVVSILGNKGSKRVCISWNNEQHSMWIDLDNLVKA
jgi:hypothetical protein